MSDNNEKKTKKPMSPEEIKVYKNTMTDRMNYKNDSFSRSFVFLGIIMDVFFFLAFYKNNSSYYYTYMMGLSILLNLIFLLTAFLAAENIKVYNRKFAYVVIGLGALQIVRMFIWPLMALINGALTSGTYIKIVVYLAISAAFLICAGVSSIIKSKRLENYNKKGE